MKGNQESTVVSRFWQLPYVDSHEGVYLTQFPRAMGFNGLMERGDKALGPYRLGCWK